MITGGHYSRVATVKGAGEVFNQVNTVVETSSWPVAIQCHHRVLYILTVVLGVISYVYVLKSMKCSEMILTIGTLSLLYEILILYQLPQSHLANYVTGEAEKGARAKRGNRPPPQMSKLYTIRCILAICQR